MDDAKRAAELVVGTSIWRSDTHTMSSYSVSEADNPDMRNALKKLHIDHEIKEGRIVVSGLQNLASLYEYNADMPGFGDHIAGLGM